jgi:hypothetical protein
VECKDERINGVLKEDKEILSKDSVAAIICLEDEMRKIKTAIALIRRGDIIAVYKGDRSEPYDSDEFILLSKREFEEETCPSKNE